MDRLKLLTIAVIILLVLNGGIVGFLLLRKPIPPPPPELFKVIVRELDLNDKQREQFFALRDEHHAAMEDLNLQFKKTFEVYLLSLKSGAERTFLDSAENKMASIEKQKASVTWDHFNKVKQLCNETQKQKFDALLPEIIKYISRERRPPPR